MPDKLNRGTEPFGLFFAPETSTSNRCCIFSMKIGEQVLFPAVRQVMQAGKESPGGIVPLVSAPGTSCRQQISDGTGIRAYHPVEILERTLVK